MSSSPLVPIPAFEALSPAFKARSTRAKERLGAQINSVHAFANAEDLGGAARDFLEAAFSKGSLPPDLRMLIRMAVSSTNACRYCTAHQRAGLAKLAVPDAKIAAIGDARSPALSPRERAAVEFAKAMTVDAGAIPRKTRDEFTAQFSAQERVEVAIVATAMGVLNTFNDALEIPLESEFERLAG